MAPSELNNRIKSLSTVSGTDIVVYLEDIRIIAAQSLRLNVTRTKQPVYVHGTANPLGFARGHRLVSGIIESALVYQANIAEWFKDVQSENDYRHYALNSVRQNFDVLSDKYGEPNSAGFAGGHSVGLYKPLFLDELPPIDITIVGVNELGKYATMRIYGVEFTEYGVTTTVENVANVETIRFLAISYDPWVIDTASGRTRT